MSLSLSDIGYTYAPDTGFATCALSRVSVEVAVGELVLVLGSTGSGKSTLLRVAAGLLEAQAGRALIDGEPLNRVSARGEVGLVFQDAEAQLFADTLLDDVAFGPRNLGLTGEEAAARAREALLTVGLDPEVFGGRSPFALSGGEARRAAIAGVLAMRPRYLLADEPTAGLDANGRAAMRAIVADVRQRAGVMLVSHSAEEFLGEADRVLVLFEGGSAWYGDASALIVDPAPLEAAGLAAPAVLAVQRSARLSGIDPGPFTLDPRLAADNLATAGGWV